MSNLADVRRWIDGYVKAWNSNDPNDIRDLFTEDAEYSTEPYKPSWRGSDAIVKGWLDHQDKPGETTFVWEPLQLTDDLAIITGTTTYPDLTYSNLWIIRLAEDGRCQSFAEWWMEHPKG
jgi:uncharacterized protein (TIGR02246 family)